LTQYAKGDIWLEFVGGGPYGPNNNFYLTTYNNCAMIQTGHSNGSATPDEQKILANLIFYCYQLSELTTTTDYSAMDYAAPNTPTVSTSNNSNGTMKVTFSSADNGTTYKHKIEAYNKSNLSTPVSTSNIATNTVTSGTKGFYYVVDDNATNNFSITSSTSFTTDTSINLNYGSKYIHVKAIDKAGNVSAVKNYALPTKANVTYNVTENGGTGTNEVVATVIGSGVDLTKTATKTAGGYDWEFVGWNTDPNAKEGLESFTMPANDVTLYAIYRRYVVVEFYDYNGTVTKDYRMDGYVYNNETGLKLTTPEAGTYTGYPESGAWSFLYFVNNSSSTDLTKAPKEIYYANTESIFPKSEKYFAVYKRTVPISFVSINGTAKQTQNIDVDQKISAKTALSMTKLTLTAPEAFKPSKTNGVEWTFKHWKESTSFVEDSDEEKALPKYSEGQTFTASKKTTYYAMYERTVNITFHDYKDGSKNTFKKGSLQLVNAYNPKNISTKGMELPDANEITGWTFLGWAEDGEVLDYNYSSGETVYVTKPMDMYAIYEKPININFVYIDTLGNKKTNTVESTQYANANDINTYATDAEYTAPTVNSFVYNNKTWKPLYWSKDTASNASKSLAFGEDATTKTDLTYYAVYSSKMTAEFISIRGNDNVPTYVEGTTYVNANDKTKSTAATITAPSLNTCTVDSKTWTAKGWSEGTAYNSAITVNPGATVTLTGNKTFYGIYTSAYTATFIDYNGSEKRTQTVDVGSVINSFDKEVHMNNGVAPAIGIYNDGTSNWVINGWTTSKDANSKEFESEASFSIDKDTTYYATYTRDVTVNLVDFVSGASTTTKKTAKAYVNSYNIDNKTDAAFTIPTQNGHVTNGKSWNAVGWTTSSSSSSLGDIKYYSAQTISTNKDITIYAMYTRDITVTYNGNGGTNPASSTGTKIINASGATSNPLIQITNTIPVRTSLKFANKWLTGIKSGTEYVPGLYYQFTDDTTLYAQWILETVDLTATINWEDNSNVMNSRPEFIRLSVYRDGQKISSFLVSNLDDTISAPTANKTIPVEGIKVTVDKTTNTTNYTFVDLQKYNPSNGAAYNYTLVQEPFISENNEVDYSQVVSADTWTITNVMVDANNKPIEGTIYWYDDSNAWHLRPSELTITLLKKDPDTNVVTKQTKTVKAGASDSVSYIFEKQAAVNSNKNPYEYTVSINNITLYTVTNTDFDFECTLANLPGGFTGGEGNNLVIAADAFNWKGNVAKADDYFATATNEDMSVLVTLKTIKKTWTGSGLNRHEVWNNNQYMTDDKGDVV
ncbi:MAG: Cna B-type domain-containing protein, partial [Bacteroidales bacterium]|nr:Cna B-type domain-containing protein [Bacteroidales bacterium]